MNQPLPHRRRLLGAGATATLLLAAGAARAQGAARAAAAAPPAAGSDRGGPPPAVGTLLPLPEITLLDGRTLTPASFDGQVLVLYWWASWCPFCALQSPLMERLWRAQQGRGLKLVGLSIDRKPQDATAYLARHGYTFPAALVTPAIARVLPKAKGLPITLVRGRDGRVLMGEAGQLFPEDVEQIARFL